MIFLIDKIDSGHQVIVYEDILDLIQRVDWQDILRLNLLLLMIVGINTKETL